MIFKIIVKISVVWKNRLYRVAQKMLTALCNFMIFEDGSINYGEFKKKKKLNIFSFRIFYNKWKISTVWNCLRWNTFKCYQLFCLRQFKMAESQTESWGLSTYLWWLRSANHVKFTKECLICTENNVLVEKMYKWAIHKIATMSLNEETAYWTKYTDPPVEKNSGSSRQFLSVFWDMKWLFTDFPEKCTTINRNSACQLLKQNALYSFNNTCNFKQSRHVHHPY